jgi:hypothetical protein
MRLGASISRPSALFLACMSTQCTPSWMVFPGMEAPTPSEPPELMCGKNVHTAVDPENNDACADFGFGDL